MSESLSPEMIRHITDYLLIERTALKKADLIFVFGNKEGCAALAAETVSLYMQGYAPRILVSGGYILETGEREAHFLRRRLIESGVPDHAIIVEDQSGNTQENIEMSRAKLRGIFNDSAIGSVIGVGHISAGRRFMMTMAKRWRDVTHMFVGVNPHNTPVQDWHKDPLFRQQVLNEYKKIPDYVARGFIEEVDIAAINKQIELQP